MGIKKTKLDIESNSVKLYNLLTARAVNCNNISRDYRRLSTMTNNEVELFKIIRSHADPEQAVLTAIDVILGFLAQDESSQERSAACPREFA